MAGDAPDFSFGTVDLPPLVINTMPILKNYPGGSVFYFDNFEGSDITWDIAKEVGWSGSYVEIDKTHAYIGAGCVRLYRNEDQRVMIILDRRFQFRPSDTIGIEFSFMLSDKIDARVNFIYEYKINNTNYQFFINFEGDNITIYTSEGNIIYPYSSGNGLNNMAWNNFKVVLNIKDHRYVRLYYGKDVFDIDRSAEVLSGGTSTSPHISLGFFAFAGGSAQKSMWIDKVILTDDEII